MANTNDMNAPTKVPCGGFVLGEGLALSKDGKTLNVTGGGGSQADWNQNDETAVDYVKNRPGGYDIKELVTVTDETATSGQLLTNYSAVTYFFTEHAGETVVVTFDGTPYQCTIIGDAGRWYVGDPNFVEYPFCIRSSIRIDLNPDNPAELYTAIAGESHTVKIEGYATTPAVFNKKYLPDLKTLTNTQSYNANSYLVCDKNSNVRWMQFSDSDSLIAPKSYVDARITQKEVILESSTGGSSKKFKITVDDTGAIKATEVTNN